MGFFLKNYTFSDITEKMAFLQIFFKNLKKWISLKKPPKRFISYMFVKKSLKIQLEN